MTFRYVLDPAITTIMASTSAIPGGDIARAAWGRKGPPSDNAFDNLMNRIRVALADDPDLELVSTTYYRIRRRGEP
jgi:hypothetical protein